MIFRWVEIFLFWFGDFFGLCFGFLFVFVWVFVSFFCLLVFRFFVCFVVCLVGAFFSAENSTLTILYASLILQFCLDSEFTCTFFWKSVAQLCIMLAKEILLLNGNNLSCDTYAVCSIKHDISQIWHILTNTSLKTNKTGNTIGFCAPGFPLNGKSRISSALTTGKILHHLCKTQTTLRKNHKYLSRALSMLKVAVLDTDTIQLTTN